MTEEFSGFKERRKFPRVSLYAIVRYLCPILGVEIEVQTRIADISEGGVQLVLPTKGIPEGAPVKMNFVTPGDQGLLVSVEGVARHTEALDQNVFRTGVEFIRLKEKDRITIRKYIDSRTKK